MNSVQVRIPNKLIDVFSGPADVRGAYGGRGSGKTMSFAKMAAVIGLMHASAGVEGIILCCRQYMNSLADSSLEEIKAAIRSEPWLLGQYEIGEKYVRTADGRVSFAFAGMDRSIDSIKSKARILVCWVDEAEPVTEEAWRTLIPTLRAEGDGWNAELWVTWNPKRKMAAVESRFRNSSDPLVKVVALNWTDNPKFPDKLDRERRRDMEERPESYEHVWEGGFSAAVEGAYYSKLILEAREQKRIGRVAADPMMSKRAFIDIGGTGARADAFAMWVTQFIGREIRVIDYYEAVGQPLPSHLAWMRKRGYSPGELTIWLPHDGATHDKVYSVSYESALVQAGYSVEVIPNQGRGAAAARIESGRRVFPRCWINEETCESGLDALAWYHEKRDEVRNIGLGPDHDWSSHAADAWGLLAIVAEDSARYGVKQVFKRRGSPMAA